MFQTLMIGLGNDGWILQVFIALWWVSHVLNTVCLCTLLFRLGKLKLKAKVKGLITVCLRRLETVGNFTFYLSTFFTK